MLGVEQVVNAAFHLICAIMFHPAFHFEGEHTRIRLSCSHNYFCFPPLFQGLPLCHSLPLAWLSIPPGGDATIPVSGVCPRGSLTVRDSIHSSERSWGIKWGPAVLPLGSICLPECAALMDWSHSSFGFYHLRAHFHQTLFSSFAPFRSSVRTVRTALALE